MNNKEKQLLMAKYIAFTKLKRSDGGCGSHVPREIAGFISCELCHPEIRKACNAFSYIDDINVERQQKALQVYNKLSSKQLTFNF